MAKHNKKQMAVTATSFLVAGYMFAELLRSFGPEDDDEKSEYEKATRLCKRTIPCYPRRGQWIYNHPASLWI